MTDNDVLPVVRESTELDRLARVGTWLAYAESGQNTPEARGATAALRMYYAESLDLPPLAAKEISFIKGNVYMSAKLRRALALRAGYQIHATTTSDETKCTAVLVKDGNEIGRRSYTIEQATKAGLVRNGSGWENYPDRMLWAKASARVIDDFAPQVTLGLLAAAEAEEIDGVVIEEPEYADFGPVAEQLDNADDIPWPAPDGLEDDPPDPSDYQPAA